MRLRWLMALLASGVALLLVSLPLWSSTRSADCRDEIVSESHPSKTVCDPRLHLPFGDLALIVTILGVVAMVAAIGVLLAWGLKRVRDRNTLEQSTG
jgi:hypothetical protein